jgi:hypothetical protein
MHNKLNAIYDWAVEIFKDIASPVIAGGAVRDSLMDKEPKDYDVFLMGHQYEDDIKDKVIEVLKPYEKIYGLEWHKSEPYLVTTIKVLDSEVQILVTPIRSIPELLNSFDWNVCLFAYGVHEGKLQVVQHAKIEDIGKDKFLKLNKLTYPLSTLRRGYRFSERFKMRLSSDDLEKIIAECHKHFTLHNNRESGFPSMASQIDVS